MRCGANKGSIKTIGKEGWGERRMKGGEIRHLEKGKRLVER